MEWRGLSWLPNYEFSDFGGCRRTKSDTYPKIKNRPLRGTIDSDGYRVFKLTLPDGTKIARFAHRLCCEAFRGPKPEGKREAAHWDGNRLNNHTSNLRWATAQENADDRYRHAEERRQRIAA